MRYIIACTLAVLCATALFTFSRVTNMGILHDLYTLRRKLK